MPLERAFLALGSNLDDRLANLHAAIRGLESGGDLLVVRGSRVYENRAIGMGDADAFYNAVIEIRTCLTPDRLLERCMQVETALGRVRSGGWAPRTMDIDILIYGSLQQALPHLQLPHPRIGERDFVLKPLSNLVPEFELKGRTVFDLLEALEVVDLQEVDCRLWPAAAINVIAACSENLVIGRDGVLPWLIAEDWEIFLQKTLGGVLIMGRLSFLEMVKEPSWQVDRSYVVLTSQPELVADYGVLCVCDFADALKAAAEIAHEQAIWICGGQAIYEQALDSADHLHLTLIHREVEGDTYFPRWDASFAKTAASVASADTKETFTFKVFEA